MMKQAAAALVVLMSLLLAHEPQHAAAIYQPEDVLLSWNLLDEPIDTLLQKMHVILADNKPRLTIGGHAVLAPKDAAPGSPPCRWLKVTIFAGDQRATLAFGDSDIYLLAFQNISGRHWSCFDGYDTSFPNGRNLSFSENYKSLKGGHKKLVEVRLGKAATLWALSVLSGYNPSVTRTEDVKVALATFMLSISEALRFTEIREVITKAWEWETYLKEEMTNLVVNWGQTSYCLYLWERTGVWPGRKECKGPRSVGITSGAEALKKLDLLKRPQVISINSTAY